MDARECRFVSSVSQKSGLCKGSQAGTDWRHAGNWHLGSQLGDSQGVFLTSRWQVEATSPPTLLIPTGNSFTLKTLGL